MCRTHPGDPLIPASPFNASNISPHETRGCILLQLALFFLYARAQCSGTTIFQRDASSSFQSEAPHPELVELTFAWRQETSTLRDRLLEASLAAERAKAEAMEAELLAQVAARDIERFQAELAQAESLIAERNAQIEAQRHRVQMLEKAAALPWYAWRRRRELFAAAERRLLS